ncbi:unnamed protein product [Parnassius apollo]|uniref:(apollo) hypothetical protein n=1 Tax=Parnassius apollo TaxID=110799 RepID=A0A8S3X9G1_PARAO|nr:unnamed protein product [Parnassius apollo]
MAARCGAAQAAAREPPPVPVAGTRPAHAATEKDDKTSLWKKMKSITKEDLDSFDGPERLDIYRFESESATLMARGVPPTQLERVVRRSARPAARLLGELLAAPRLLAALPAALLVVMLRTALTPVRDTVVGFVQTLSDFVLKPALALSFNALLQPVLVCAGQATRALREALQPLTLALADAADPPARLLAALRLVHVERHCHCAHAV